MPRMNRPPNHACKYLTHPFIGKPIFKPKQCQEIIDFCLENWEEKPGLIGYESDLDPKGIREDLDYRNSICMHTSATLGNGKPFENKFFNKVFESVFDFNDSEIGYGYELFGPIESPMFLIYNDPEIDSNNKPGQYKYHMDIGDTFPMSNRKIAYSIFLNYGDYEGGEWEYYVTQDATDVKAKQPQRGTIILFSSFLLHRVTPVTKGTRYALTGWMHGNSFR